MVNMSFPFGSLELGYVLDRVLCDQSPGKTLGTASLMDFPGWQHSICIVTTCCWGNSECPLWLLWERTLRSLCHTSPHPPFPFADFALCLYNKSRLQLILCPVSPPRKSLNLGTSWHGLLTLPEMKLYTSLCWSIWKERAFVKLSIYLWKQK